METKRFTKNDAAFVCRNCERAVEPLGYTSRNHCPYCLYSLHADIMPGDRASDCGALMKPVKAEPDPKRGFVIIHKCTGCGAIRRNKAAKDDNVSLIIRLTAAEMEEEL